MTRRYKAGPDPAVTAQRLTLGRRIGDWLGASTLAPRRLKGRWRHPLVGYSCAGIAALLSVALTALLKEVLPGYAFLAALSILATLGMASNWGAGPAVLTALLSSLLLMLVVFSPHVPPHLQWQAHLVGFLAALAVCVTIALVASAATAAVRRLEVLQSISDAALGNLAGHTLLRTVLGRITEVFDVDNAAILVPTPDGQHLVLHIAYGPEEEITGQMRIPVGQGIAGRIAATRQPVVVDDLRTVEVANPLLKQVLRSLMGVPLVLQDRLVGVVHVGTIRPRRFSAEDVKLLRLVGERIGLALDHARLFAEEQRLRREEAGHRGELEAVFEAIADGVYVFDRAGHVQRHNSAARELLQTTEPPAFYASPPEAQTRCAAVHDQQDLPWPSPEWPLSRVLQGEVLTGARAVDVPVRTSEGQMRDLSVSAAPIRDQHGLITGAVCVVRDVTERRRLETRIVAERNRLQQIVDVLPEGIMIADAKEPTIVAMNQAAQELLGLNLVAQPVPIPPPGRQGEFAARRLDGSPYPLEELPLERALLRGEEVRGEQLLVRNAATGREIVVLASSATVRDDHGAVDGAVVVFQDITSLKDLDRQREEFLATVSHDLKNPLTNVLGTSQLLQRRVGRLPEQERARFADGLSAIAQTAWQMAAQINELLDLTRVQMGRPLHLDLRPTDVSALLAAVIDEYQRTTEQHTLRLESEQQALICLVDAERLRRALANLLANAIKYSPRGGDIHVSVTRNQTRDGASLTISVADQGIGIPQAEVDRVFDGFYRGSNVVAHFAGTGLGLTGVRQVVAQHGGVVELETTEGVGTTVRVHLPLRTAPSSEEGSG